MFTKKQQDELAKQKIGLSNLGLRHQGNFVFPELFGFAKSIDFFLEKDKKVAGDKNNILKHLSFTERLFGSPLVLYDDYKLHESFLEIIIKLIDLKADLNQVNHLNNTALHIAAQFSLIEEMRVLLEAKANPNLENNLGDNPLITAIKENDKKIDVIKILLESKVNPNQSNHIRETPLIIATRNKDLHAITLLLGHKADVFCVNNEGKNALSYAKVAGGEKIIKTLESHQRDAFYQKFSKEKIIEINQKHYVKVKPLEGRGQKYEAGFFLCLEDGLLYVIKEDDAATCILEGSADFIIPLIPGSHLRAINLAEFATITENKSQKIVSIQPAIVPSTPWACIVFGSKRDPATIRSVESKNQNKLSSHIAGLTNQVKMDAAVSIYGSNLSGEESMHSGQYVVRVDKQGNIITIVRIDLGARERFAILRNEEKDFKIKTSDVYAKSGQFGKTYMEFMLVDPNVHAFVIYLWARHFPNGVKQHEEEIALSALESFKKQFNKIIDDEKKQAVLNEIYDVYNKNGTVKRKTNVTFEQLSQVILSVVKSRVISMKHDARNKLDTFIDELKKHGKESGLSSELIHHCIKIIDYRTQYAYRYIDRAPHILDAIKKIIFNLHHTPSLEDKEKNKISFLFQNILSYMYAAIKLSSDIPHVNVYLSKQQALQKLLNEIEVFQIHLNLIMTLQNKMQNDFSAKQNLVAIDALKLLTAEGGNVEGVIKILKNIPQSFTFFEKPEEMLIHFFQNELQKYKKLDGAPFFIFKKEMAVDCHASLTMTRP